MMFSTSENFTCAAHPTLANFVLNVETTGLPAHYGIEMHLVRGPYMRSIGDYCYTAGSGLFRGYEVAFTPFAFQLATENTTLRKAYRIDHFANYSRARTCNELLFGSIGELWSKYPGDYRTLDEIESDRNDTP